MVCVLSAPSYPNLKVGENERLSFLYLLTHHGRHSSPTQFGYGLQNNLTASLKFVHRNEFTRAVCFANIPWPIHDCFAAEHRHLRGLSSKRYCSCPLFCKTFKHRDDSR